MTAYLQNCEVVHEQMFDSHPVLQATFNIDAAVANRTTWSLPRSLDDLQFDEELVKQNSEVACANRQTAFAQALDEGNMNEAMRQFALSFEESFATACVDSDGRACKVPVSCWKRCRNKIKKSMPVAAPVLKRGGQSDFSVSICQPSQSVRRHVKQLRRIQSLWRQLQALERGGSDEARIKCQTLWICICEANGFEKGFQKWVLDCLGMFVPTCLPSAAYVEALYLAFQEVVLDEVSKERYERLCFRKMQVMEDIGRGGRLAFRSVRDADPPPLSFIGFMKKQCIARQKWSKEGRSKVLYIGECVLEPGMPVVFQGQTTMLVDVDERFLHVQPPVVCKKMDDLQFQQECFTAEPQGMQTHVANAWKQMWQCPENCDEDKERVAEFVRGIGDCPSCQFKPFTVEAWRDMLRGVKCRSSRGACGFSMLDLKRTPPKLLGWLFQIYAAVEAGAKWPERLTLARVVMLSKPGEPVHKPLGVRPITILSVLYRLWSRYRSLQVLTFLGQNVPPQIGGIASKLSADSLCAMVSDIIDDAHFSSAHVCGLVIDLQKCFNLVPRWPLKMLLTKLGLPQEYVTAHLAMLNNLDRYLDIAGQIGDIISSSNGVPEGCAMSVTCMVALTILASDVLQKVSDEVQVSMFADNWAVITQTVGVLKNVLARLEELVSMLGMRLSPAKSWTWATSTNLRKQLKDVTMNGEQLQVVQGAKDLGCDVAYTKKLRKKTSNERLKKSLRVLQRVKIKKIPKPFLGCMCTAVGVGTVAFGSELGRYTNKQFHSLRCAIAATMGLYKSGANTLLATSVTGITVDPQVRLMRRRLKFFRRFFHVFPARKAQFLVRITKRVGKRVAGLAAQFRCALLDMGWTCVEDGNMRHECGIVCNWVSNSLTYVYQCLDKAWENTAPSRIKRKGFDVEHVSAKAFQRLVHKRGPQHQGLLTAIASGKNVTLDALSHYTDCDANCPFCDCVDGKDHRVFHCNGLHDLRSKYKDTVLWLKTQPLAVTHFGIVPDDCDAVQLRQNTLQTEISTTLPVHRTVADVFTDGSCFCNRDWECALAGAAVIRVKGNYEWELAQRSLMPTFDHSAYRAEVYAVLLALQSFWHVHLHTDCSAVVDEVHRILQECANGMQPVAHSHADLWDPIIWHIKQRHGVGISITKVKAHVKWQDVSDALERRLAFFNGIADLEARKSVAADNFSLWQRMEGFLERKKQTAAAIGEYHNFLCEMHDRFFALKRVDKPVIAQPSFESMWDLHGPFEAVSAPGDDLLEGCPYGKTFALRVKSWWERLAWTTGSHISIVELYIDFSLLTGTQVPVRFPGQWLLRDQCVRADTANLRLGQQTHVWLKMLRWWLQNSGYDGKYQFLKMSALREYGYAKPIFAINMRPVLVDGPRTSNALWQYLRSGGSTVQNLTKPWTPKMG